MSANTGLARKIARAHILSTQVLDLARRRQRDAEDLDCLILVLQALKDGHLFQASVTPRLLPEDPRLRSRRHALRIDCDAQPHLPEGWEIRPEDQIASRVRGQLEFDPARIAFHLAEEQKTGRIVGIELRKQLEGQLVLPANMLDALLADTRRIPDFWKQDGQGNTRYIYFWGTIYRDRDGDLYVRCLYWRGGQWRWAYNYLTGEFGAGAPAALLVS